MSAGHAITRVIVVSLLLLALAHPIGVVEAAGVPPGGTFVDDDGNTHEGMIEAIAALGITLGCGGTLYCPDDPVTRGQMASFLARAFKLPATTIDHFDDDNGSTHETNINAIAEAGIAAGFADGTYRPDDTVTRAQMGSFLARAMGLDPVPGDRFADVSGTHEPNINAIADAGVTLGCNADGTLYCPADPVRRDQMASFLGRGLDLTAMIVPPRQDGPILFMYGVVEGSSLATINPDGSDLTFLNTGVGQPGCPARSPDGTKIAFNHITTFGAFIIGQELVVADADGSNPTVLLDADGCPSWSPDGTQLAVSGVNGLPGIWVLDADGNNPVKINDSARSPDWSPAGDLIAVVGEGWIYTVRPPGFLGPVAQLVQGGENPDWSPDGAQLAFDKSVGGIRQVFIAGADGTDAAPVTSGGFFFGSVEPDWSPTGTQIAFSSDRGGDTELYVVGADGTGLRAVTDTFEDEFPGSPDW